MSYLKEIIIGKNEKEQRLDRFVFKYLDLAPRSFVFRMIRKKNITVNDKRAKAEDLVFEGDRVKFYLADATIDKFQSAREEVKSKIKLDIVYEDDHIILLNKEAGLLCHGDGSSADNLLDGMISYLISSSAYDPNLEKTFRPALANRLDRNTSGLVIGAKSYDALKEINEALRGSKIKRYYKAIVKGQLREEGQVQSYLLKDGGKNKVSLSQEEQPGARKIVTGLKRLASQGDYSLLQLELITGRSHQLRAQLQALDLPIIGDPKYGDRQLNRKFARDYKLQGQWLYSYKVEFDGLGGDLAYLNKQSFELDSQGVFARIEAELF